MSFLIHLYSLESLLSVDFLGIITRDLINGALNMIGVWLIFYVLYFFYIIIYTFIPQACILNLHRFYIIHVYLYSIYI